MNLAFTDTFVRRPVLASVVSLMILVLGARAILSLDVRQFPRTENTVVTVTTTYAGASSELIKGFITTPLQQAIAEADGIDYLTSSSKQGVSTIEVTMKLNYDAHAAVSEIQSKVASQRRVLPQAADDPVIDAKTGDPAALMYIAFYSDAMTPQQITDYLLRVVRPQLQAIPGVAKAAMFGGSAYAMRIWLDPRRMAALGVTAADVARVLQANNFLASAGRTRDEFVAVDLSATTDATRIAEFRDMVIRAEKGVLVRLSDIARTDLGAESYDTTSWYKTNTASYIGIDPTPGSNPLTVARAVRAKLPDLESQMPAAMKLRVPYDASLFIEDSIREVFKTLLEAVAIVLVVIFLCLGSGRAALIPAVAVPLSIVGGALLMLPMGFSINSLTLLAMVLAIGLVVDDAIVIVENVHRHMELGRTPFEAALVGARELRLPVISMTTTLVAVYAPIGFMGGLVGTLFTEFAFSLAGAVLISGVVALTLSPMLCSKLFTNREGRFEHAVERFFGRLGERYRELLHGTLDYVPVTILFGILVLPIGVAMFMTSKNELAPDEDQGILFVMGRGPETATIDYNRRYARDLVDIFQTIPEHTESFFMLGMPSANSIFAGFRMKPMAERERSQLEIQNELVPKLNNALGYQAFAFPRPSLPGPSRGAPIQFVVLTAADYADLDSSVDDLLGQAMKSGKFMFLQKSVEFTRPRTTIVVDRDRAGILGITMQDVARELGTLLGEGHVNWFNLDERSYKVIPQVEQAFRANHELIDNYYIRAATGELLPLSSFVTFKDSVEPSERTQFQQLNALTLQGVASPGVSMGEALGTLEKLAREVLPQGYAVDYAGVSRQYKQVGSSLTIAIFLAAVVIYLVLAAQFESWRDPLIILTSVPLSLAGALAFITVGFASINIYTEVGMITLIGLIAKNGILIVEFANHLQADRGMTKREAIEHGAMIRLRPILMTTVAMIVAMVPLLIATGPGAVSRFHIGLVIASGLGIGTLFTLFVVPAFYLLLARDHRASVIEPLPDELAAVQ
ncbi:MAG: efflux RND transporter permease subunit [Gammaproteobacteria bacterium]|nr:efflux RND transporter permease subunit [Gammaproteobacteria bacterium]